MIYQKELYDLSEKLNIQSFVLDKDWALGHFLNAMFENDNIKSNFVFKGGTCLKKCYFNEYRYSEDLDFTLIDKDFIVNKDLFDSISSIAEKNSGAGFYLSKIKQQIYNDTPQGYEIIIAFWGADHKPNQTVLSPERWQTTIKIDISFTEKVLLQPERKKIIHPYSDSDNVNSVVAVYPINEIISEKLRALMQRNRPRDIYDLYFLSQQVSNEDYPVIYNLLLEKSKDKKLDCCKLESFVNPIKAKRNKRAWENSLGHHLAINKLVDFETAYRRVSDFISNII